MRSLMQQTVFEIKYEMLCERTRHRQRAAKADLERRRVDLCVRISSLYTPPRRKAFLSLQHRRCPVIGANDRFYVKHPRLRGWPSSRPHTNGTPTSSFRVRP
jgi:hypothetical protein